MTDYEYNYPFEEIYRQDKIDFERDVEVLNDDEVN